MTNFNNPQGDKNPNDLPLTPTEKSYQEGYSQGRVTNEDTQYQRERAAENSGAASGLAIGGTLAALIGIGAAAVYFWGRPTEPVPTTIINTPASPAASTTPKPAKETKIIERTIEKAAPPAPSPQVIEVPKPILVPGATKIIEVPKPYPVPAAPTAPKASDAPKPTPTPASSPAPAASQSPETTDSLPPTNPANNNN